MIADGIVIASLVLAAVFSIAWLTRPALRERIERPNHRFQDAVRQYDRQCRDGGDPARRMSDHE